MQNLYFGRPIFTQEGTTSCKRTPEISEKSTWTWVKIVFPKTRLCPNKTSVLTQPISRNHWKTLTSSTKNINKFHRTGQPESTISGNSTQQVVNSKHFFGLFWNVKKQSSRHHVSIATVCCGRSWRLRFNGLVLLGRQETHRSPSHSIWGFPVKILLMAKPSAGTSRREPS